MIVIESYNKNRGDIEKHYIDKAVLFWEKDACIKGNKDIADYYINSTNTISKICRMDVDARFIEASDLIYETGSFSTDKNEKYQYIFSWKNNGGKWLKELEVIAKKTYNENIPVEISESRKNWINICATHDSKKLVESLYMKDAFYYNRGRVLHGWQEISTEYSYMDNPSYSVNLQPKIVSLVQPDIAFEIGKCSSSYQGHYILKWEKESMGQWKISLDSNY